MKKLHLIQKLAALLLLSVILITTLSGAAFGAYLRNEPDVSPNPPPGSKPKTEAAPKKETPSKTQASGQALPLYDIAVKSGKTFPLQMTAPAGAEVTATIAGKTYALSPIKVQVKESTYVAHKRDFTLPSVSGTEDLGPVTYQVVYKDKSWSKSSDGSLFAVGENDTLKVQVKNNSATVFNDSAAEKSSGYRTVARQGAIDTVVDYKGDLYKLGTGGWITASNVTPLTQNLAVNNPVSSTSLVRQNGSEILRLEGATHPVFTASHTSDTFTITLFRTTGVSTVSMADSSIFSDMSVSESDGHTTITLLPKSSGSLWSYAVEYSGGTTELVFRSRPQLADGDQPLTGITIALDPGHGGSDNGTSGIAANGSWVEKDANLAVANAAKEKLEAKGATVVMVRSDDSKIELSDRMNHAQKERVDLFVSLHCNSAPNKKATGVEVYYYHPAAKSLASNMLREFSKATDRKVRSAVQSHYIVTLGSYAPSILLEMGFMTNASEYKDICSTSGVENAAQGVYNGIVAALDA